MLVGDPSQTKDASAINLAENHSVCLQIAQRFRTVATHHKLTSKPAGMPAELWNIAQSVIPRGSKMSLAQDLRQPEFELQDQVGRRKRHEFSKSYISFNTGAVRKAQSHPNPNSKTPPIPVLSQNAKNIDRCQIPRKNLTGQTRFLPGAARS